MEHKSDLPSPSSRLEMPTAQKGMDKELATSSQLSRGRTQLHQRRKSQTRNRSRQPTEPVDLPPRLFSRSTKSCFSRSHHAGRCFFQWLSCPCFSTVTGYP